MVMIFKNFLKTIKSAPGSRKVYYSCFVTFMPCASCDFVALTI